MPELWNSNSARQVYAIASWGDGYVDVGTNGDIHIYPLGQHGPSLSLPTIVRHATGEGLRLPMLVRFSDILADRLKRLQCAFVKAIDAWHYGNGYTAIYPIKVNQQRSVVDALVTAGVSDFGLEAGSKPELMAVLGMAAPGTIVICNGYKDSQYIRLALIGRKLGLRVYIVIEKLFELDHVLTEAHKLGVEPLLGVRVRLAAIAHGKWQNTGGEKGKFGLSAAQVMTLLTRLEDVGLKHALRLQHCHMGSQISNVRDIVAGMREASRFFVDLRRLGAPLDIVDVGGGLGVDYNGLHSRDHNSINYSLEEYAATIVQAMAEMVQAEAVPPPRILTEAGRAMTAHHAVLVVSVSDVEPVPCGSVAPACEHEPVVLSRLRSVHARLGCHSPLELYHEAQHYLCEGHTLYARGHLTLADRVTLEAMYYAIIRVVREYLTPVERTHRKVLDALEEKLVDKYFVNFSVFESIPDVWAIRQVFPIMPLTRLHEKPTQRGVIVDLTCDSDGRIDDYVGAEGVNVSLPLHAPEDGQTYCLGIFLVGAYQETLGDIHNLFGDTDAVNVRLDGNGDHYQFTDIRRGDTTRLMLDYVGYDLAALRESYLQRLAAAGLEATEITRWLAILEEGLNAYTYHHIDPPGESLA